MSQTRVYLPLAWSDLRALADGRPVGPAPVPAHAVTELVERAQPGADEEDWEYTALCDAAEQAGGRRDAPAHRRVVAAADVDPGWVGEAEGALSSVVLTAPVPLRLIVSLHVDEVGGGPEDELLWYDVTELKALLSEL